MKKDPYTNEMGQSLKGLDRVSSMMDKSGNFDWIMKIMEFLMPTPKETQYRPIKHKPQGLDKSVANWLKSTGQYE
jgi:hypothetical protein